MKAALILALLPLPALAQQVGLPKGCTAFLTVQAAGCTVEHYFTCAGDPPGTRHRLEVYPDGFDFLSTTDAEGQWIETVDSYAGTTSRLEPNPADPGRWSDLLDDGVDTFDFQTIADDGTATRFVGTDKMTGRIVTIAGRDLSELVSEMRAEDDAGNVLWSMTVTGYADTVERISFGGVVNWVLPDDAYSIDDSPVSFHAPGEDGFLSALPLYGCGE
jgi:hypothetical protein